MRSSAALAALENWLQSIPPNIRRAGEQDYARGLVIAASAKADHFFEAQVAGKYVDEVTFLLTRGRWTAQCSCPLSTNCRHAAAVAHAWIANNGRDCGAPEAQVAEHSPALPAPPAKGRQTKKAFRDQWSPVIAGNLGRPLSSEEGRWLERLAALFADFSTNLRQVYSESMRRHGFAEFVNPNADPWMPLFEGWWNFNNAPGDPWALWQYIAFEAERRGREIPDVFRAMTDTTAVRALLDQRLLQEELAKWRHALSPVDPFVRAPRQNPVGEIAGLRLRLTEDGSAYIDVRTAADKPWKTPAHGWMRSLMSAYPADFSELSAAEAALGAALAAEARTSSYSLGGKRPVSEESLARLLRCPAAHGAIVLPGERPFVLASDPLVHEAVVSTKSAARLELRLIAPDGRDASTARRILGSPSPLYLFDGAAWPGPPPLPSVQLPVVALRDERIIGPLRKAGVRLPESVEGKIRRVALRPKLRCALEDPKHDYMATWLRVRLTARADDPPCEQAWSGRGGWHWAEGKAPKLRQADDTLLEFDLSAAHAVSACFADFRLTWDEWSGAWSRVAAKSFPEEFIAWHATLPPGVEVELSPELAGLLGEPLRVQVDFSALPSGGSDRDWFDLTVALRIEDTTLKPEEIALLLKARGKWIRLPKHGWRRLELTGAEADETVAGALDRLGVGAADVLATGKPATHRLHVLQLAGEAATFEARDAQLAAALRDRAARIAAIPPPALPAGLAATLRPYQIEGFHFLAHLAAHRFGGVLADDMGLGKTVQALAWLLHLAAAPPEGSAPAEPFRALVVCPKSVTHGWLTETARFAPGLRVEAFTPTLAGGPLSAVRSQVLVANYTQLRLNAEWFQAAAWDAVVLDEGQFIKNPGSRVAAAARGLPARHRLVLTGTPIENRLADLWSLFAFAQPGLLGTQTAFRRQYPDDEPAALTRLHRRVRHFLLRRTKSQAAPDLPLRTEDDLVVELEGEQRQLYEAELKRARAQLLGIETDRALDQVRFNVLASLLRLRQICCHPALLDPAHAALPSAKLDALLERIEELGAEGHQALVFSQFVEMLYLIRDRLTKAGIGHLLLTGATENRAALVDEFQRDPSKTVFLLSLKAAGFGLNLTAASYAILYDPWWNPAVEAQAIDRTHRIGQTKPVIAYRLLAADTVEQKIRALQREKAALAAAVVQEESLASVLDLDSLRQILG